MKTQPGDVSLVGCIHRATGEISNLSNIPKLVWEFPSRSPVSSISAKSSQSQPTKKNSFVSRHRLLLQKLSRLDLKDHNQQELMEDTRTRLLAFERTRKVFQHFPQCHMHFGLSFPIPEFGQLCIPTEKACSLDWEDYSLFRLELGIITSIRSRVMLGGNT